MFLLFVDYFMQTASSWRNKRKNLRNTLCLLAFTFAWGANVTPQTLDQFFETEEGQARLTDALVLKVIKKVPNEATRTLVSSFLLGYARAHLVELGGKSHANFKVSFLILSQLLRHSIRHKHR